MHWPQYVFIVIYIINFLTASVRLSKDGDIQSFFFSIGGSVFGIVVLGFGGFWTQP